jgi:hypothetical protein
VISALEAALPIIAALLIFDVLSAMELARGLVTKSALVILKKKKSVYKCVCSTNNISTHESFPKQIYL